MSTMKDSNTEDRLKYCGSCPFLNQPVGKILGYNLNPIGTERQENNCGLNLFYAEVQVKEMSKAGVMVTKLPIEFEMEYNDVLLDRGFNPRKTGVCLRLTEHIRSQLKE